MTHFEHATTNTAVAVYEASRSVFEGLMSEVRDLSKKKPDAALNKGKVRILNNVLTDLKSILTKEPEGKYLELLDDDDVPQNSDAVLVMVQFEAALSAFHRRYHVRVGHEFQWITEELLSELEIQEKMDVDPI